MALTKVSAGVLNIDDLYGFRNRVINGDMRIDQRNNGSSLTPTSSETYTIDRFLFEMGASTGHNGTIQRISDAPTGSGHTFSVRYTAGSTATWNSSSGWGAFSQRIEGFNVADFAWGTASAKPVTLSFWVKASVAGLYTVNMTHYDGSNERWNNITYTINSANTWEQKTLTFVGDTSFGITNDNGTNGWIRLYWHLGDNAGGAATTTTFNSWFAGSATKRAATGSTNIMSTSGRTWQITGVQLEVGSTATPFERRPYGLELDLCQRYFYAIRSTNVGNGDSTGINGVVGGSTAAHRTQAPHPVTMRSNTISLTFSNVSGAGTDLRVYDGSNAPNITSVGTSFSNSQAIQFDSTASGGGLTQGRAATVLWQNNIVNGYIWVSAEL